MSDRLCAGGCGTTISAANKSGFAWGHKANGCKASPPPSNPEATSAEPESESDAQPAETEVASIEMSFTEEQLDRMWQTLPLRGKAVAILTHFNSDPE